jgi:hypothetical protein
VARCSRRPVSSSTPCSESPSPRCRYITSRTRWWDRRARSVSTDYWRARGLGMSRRLNSGGCSVDRDSKVSCGRRPGRRSTESSRPSRRCLCYGLGSILRYWFWGVSGVERCCVGLDRRVLARLRSRAGFTRVWMG